MKQTRRSNGNVKVTAQNNKNAPTKHPNISVENGHTMNAILRTQTNISRKIVNNNNNIIDPTR